MSLHILCREVLLDTEWVWDWFQSATKSYWRVCHAQEDNECSNGYIFPSAFDHGIAEYIKKVTAMPDYFKEKDATHVSTFKVSYQFYEFVTD